jgi:hypothetical protein
MRMATSAPEVGFIHRKLSGSDIYFVGNTCNRPVNTQAWFRVNHSAGEWLDAQTGESFDATIASGAVKLNLAPYQSRILVLHDGANAAKPEPGMSNSVLVADLTTDWNIHFKGTDKEEIVPALSSPHASWTSNPGTLYYSGVATYRKTIHLTAAALHGKHLFLDFGEGMPLPEPAAGSTHPGMQAMFDPPIREAAVIYVNGTRAGSLWCPPYVLDITSKLKAGDNTLEVRVANTAINLLAGQTLPDYRLLWERYGRRFAPQDMDQLQPLPSGLLGKVRLMGITQ